MKVLLIRTPSTHNIFELFQSPIPSSNPTAVPAGGPSPGVPGLPDLIPPGHRERVDRYTPAIHPVDPHPGRETVIVEMHPQGVTIR